MFDFFLYYTLEILIGICIIIAVVLTVIFSKNILFGLSKLDHACKQILDELKILLDYLMMFSIIIFKKITNIQPLLDLFRTGKFIRRSLSIIIQAISFFFSIAVIIVWLRSWTFITDVKLGGAVSLIIWQLAFPFAGLIAIKMLYLRGLEVDKYPDSDFIVVPILGTLLKTWGQMYFTFSLIMSVPAMIIIWLTGDHALLQLLVMLSLPPQLGMTDAIFILGILVFIYTLVSGYFVMILTQFIAEWTLALFSIAHDVNILRRNEVPLEKDVILSPDEADEEIKV